MGFKEPHVSEGLPGAGSTESFFEMPHKESAFPKGVQVWLLSASEPKVEVGEKRRAGG